MLNLLAFPTHFSIGNWHIAVLDLIVLAILGVAFLVGYILGFSKQLFSLFGWGAAAVLGVVLCDDFALLLNKTIPSLKEGLCNLISNAIGLESAIESGQAVEEVILILEEQSTIPHFLHQPIAQAIVNAAGDIHITEVLANCVVTAISFVIVFLLSMLIFLVLKLVVKKINTEVKAFRITDKILGGVLTTVLGALAIILLTLLLSAIFPAAFESILNPVTKDGEEVFGVYNAVLTWIMDSKFIENIFNKLIAGV